MKNKRRIAGIVFLALAISFGFISYSLSKGTQKTVEIVVLNKDIDEGNLIRKQDVKVVQRGSYNLPSDVVKDTSLVIDKIALKNMKKDREIYLEEITSDSNKTSFANKIIGKAVGIKTDLASAVGGEILPESFVQIAIVAKGENGEAITTYPESTKAIRVLEVKQDNAQSTTKSDTLNTNIQEAKKPAVIVLDMTEEQIKQILPYNYTGVLHLILLNEHESELERRKLGL